MARQILVRRLSPLLLAAGLAACGGGENLPDAQLSRADLAVQRAVAAQAGQRAPAELARAQSELAAARQAAEEERYTEARRLADQAESNATLAEARAQAATDTETLDQMQDTVGDLRETAAPQPLNPTVTP
jgi:hypothetical protein